MGSFALWPDFFSGWDPLLSDFPSRGGGPLTFQPNEFLLLAVFIEGLYQFSLANSRSMNKVCSRPFCQALKWYIAGTMWAPALRELSIRGSVCHSATALIQQGDRELCLQKLAMRTRFRERLDTLQSFCDGHNRYKKVIFFRQRKLKKREVIFKKNQEQTWFKRSAVGFDKVFFI